ncbi:MAG TPA: hypothetical protein VGL11_14325 [Candidatus Binatia bacterium]|jgi:hypothetical protein
MSKQQFVTDPRGRKKILLDIKTYRKLLATVEDLEDTNELLKAEREAKGFVPYDQFRKTFLKKR